MDHENDIEMEGNGLKSAVQGAWGAERAPQRLRGRIGHLIATARTVDDAPSNAVSAWDRWSSRVYGLVAAAVLLLSVGLLTMYYQGYFRPRAAVAYGHLDTQPPPTKIAVPITLARTMITTHAACGMHDHHIVDRAIENNYAALSVKLTADLGFPTLARSIGPEWSFRGAGECAVAGQQASHLLFARGGETVSVFTLPLHCAGVEAGTQFEGMVQQHPVAGFARPGALYAVVGSSPDAARSLEMITAIRDALLMNFEPGACDPGVDPLDF